MKKFIPHIMVGIMLTASLLLASCDTRRLINVDASPAVLKAAQLDKATYADADRLIKAWELETNALQTSLKDAEGRYAQLQQITTIGLDFARTASEGFPYGGVAFAVLTGLTGLVLPQPKILKQKEKTE